VRKLYKSGCKWFIFYAWEEKSARICTPIWPPKFRGRRRREEGGGGGGGRGRGREGAVHSRGNLQASFKEKALRGKRIAYFTNVQRWA
jgi:hypothetical protein